MSLEETCCTEVGGGNGPWSFLCATRMLLSHWQSASSAKGESQGDSIKWHSAQNPGLTEVRLTLYEENVSNKIPSR